MKLSEQDYDLLYKKLEYKFKNSGNELVDKIKNKEEFAEKYSEHLVEDFERKEWWGNETFPLFMYKVSILDKFDSPKKVEIPQGVQVFIKPESIKFV